MCVYVPCSWERVCCSYWVSWLLYAQVSQVEHNSWRLKLLGVLGVVEVLHEPMCSQWEEASQAAEHASNLADLPQHYVATGKRVPTEVKGCAGTRGG